MEKIKVNGPQERFLDYHNRRKYASQTSIRLADVEENFTKESFTENESKSGEESDGKH